VGTLPSSKVSYFSPIKWKELMIPGGWRMIFVEIKNLAPK